MPIEVEDKFVLYSKNDLEKILRKDLKKYQGSIYEIHQAYLGSEGRIRKREQTHRKGRKLAKPIVDLTFTYKHKLSKRKGSLEFEMKISQYDFDLAWNEEKTVSLTKTRIALHMPWDEQWEIDFIKHNNLTHFIVAECEMPTGEIHPKQIPDIVKDNLFYQVPDNDRRFKNRQLVDPLVTAKLLSDLRLEISNDKIREQITPVPLQSILSQKRRRNVS